MNVSRSICNNKGAMTLKNCVDSGGFKGNKFTPLIPSDSQNFLRRQLLNQSSLPILYAIVSSIELNAFAAGINLLISTPESLIGCMNGGRTYGRTLTLF